MEKVTKRKQRVLDVLDKEIGYLEERLEKAQPLINELQSLRATRARLLDERSTTSGGGRRNAQLTMESVVHWFSEHEAGSPQEIAQALGVEASIVRSHLNRHADVRYRKNGLGEWTLIGGTEEDEDEED